MDPSSVFAWALDPARDDDDEDALVRGLAGLVVGAGVSVTRLSTSFRPLDPTVFARAVTWDGVTVTMLDRSRTIVSDHTYVGSTAQAIHDGAPEIRERLDPAKPSSFALLADLARSGHTDYLIKPIVLDRRVRTFVSYASSTPEGFTAGELAYLAAIHPAVQALLRLRSMRLTTAAVARTYLGPNAAERVLSGHVERGHGERISAAIWFCDLRDFTVLSDSLPPDQLLRLLDSYFETVAGQVGDRGGEVLKFIGDAILAIFPVTSGASGPQGACARAFEAAEAALDRFETDVATPWRATHGLELGLGISLHLGEVFYGNIGARDRLDFTVIGAAVNLAARVQGLCKPLRSPLLVTQALATHVPELRSVGAHALKGIKSPTELFTLARFVR